MTKYCVAWMNFFDNEIHQEVVSAITEKGALFKSQQDTIHLEDEDMKKSLEELKRFAFDCDGMISVIEIH